MESEVFTGGSSRMIEFYPGWYGYDIPTLYRYVGTTDYDYIQNMDVYLMYMSKGGITLSDLNKIGIRTKDLYLQKYLDLYHKVYGDGKDDNPDLPEGVSVG